MFKHSKKDFILVVLGLIQVPLLALPFFVSLSVSEIIAVSILNVLLISTNYQCVSHNFIHLPFFKSSVFNKIFSVLNSVGIGIPQSAYRLHHLQHHRYNNRPEEDDSSTLRYGKNGKEENIIAYSVLGVFRTDVPGLVREAAKKSKLVYLELLFQLLFLGVLLFIDWKMFLTFLVPTYFFGMVASLWENYCEHHHANPYDRKRDSVSSYDPLYNFLWFNNGYHQEHHYSPQTHWTEVPKIKASLPDDRIIVKGCHLTNSF